MDSPGRRDHVFKVFESHLKVALVPGSRLITITYENTDPDIASKVVNTLANELAQTSFRTRYQSVQQMSSWLSDQLDSVRAQADALEQQEEQLHHATDTFALGGTNAAGESVVYSPLLDHLQQATQTLSQAEANRIARGAVDQIVQTRDPKLISGLAGSGLAGSGNPQSADSLEEIRKLQGQIDALNSTIAADEQRFGEANPKLIQARAVMASLKTSLEQETDRLVARAHNDFNIATKDFESANSQRNLLMKQADGISDKELQYKLVHIQAQDARNLYTALNNRVREAGVLAGLQAADMTVVSVGYAPALPSSPHIMLVLAASLVSGLILGIVVAGIVDVRDDKVNSVATVETELGIPVYSILPDFNSTSRLYQYGQYVSQRVKTERQTASAVENPIHVIAHGDSQYSESMRSLRTAILLARTGEPAKTILVTSSTPSEGKSTTSVNLAATFARTGVRTLVVEVDLRKPVLARRMGLPPSNDGLTRMLTGQLERDFCIPLEDVPNLFCIPAGQRPPDPYELISSPAMAELVRYWNTQYDLVLLDGPPVLPVIDSVLLSQQTDLVLVITRFGRTSINSLRTAHRLLSRQVRVNIGAVLNAVSQGSEGYYDYYGYRYSSYKYEGTEEAQ